MEAVGALRSPYPTVRLTEADSIKITQWRKFARLLTLLLESLIKVLIMIMIMIKS